MARHFRRAETDNQLRAAHLRLGRGDGLVSRVVSFHVPQIRATEAREIPSSAASSRADQCVTPNRAGGRPSSARVATTTSTSSISGSRPLRG
jgi:hypothetical protein